VGGMYAGAEVGVTGLGEISHFDIIILSRCRQLLVVLHPPRPSPFPHF
jgi:hypothetical protein